MSSYFDGLGDFDGVFRAAQSTLSSAQSSFENTVKDFEKTSVASNLQHIFALDNLQADDETGPTKEPAARAQREEVDAGESREPAAASKSFILSTLKIDVGLAGPGLTSDSEASVHKELQAARAKLSMKEAECGMLQAEIADKTSALASKDADCEILQRQIAVSKLSLSAEQSTSAELRAQIQKLRADNQKAQEIFEDELTMSRRNLADVKEELGVGKAEIESLTSTMATVKSELVTAIAAASTAAATATATAAATAAMSGASPSPSPSSGGKGKGKGGAGQGGDNAAATKQLKTDLSTSETKRAALEEKLVALRAQVHAFEDHNTASERRAKRFEEDLGACQRELKLTVDGLNARIAALTSEVADKGAEAISAKEVVSKLTADLSLKSAALGEVIMERDVSKISNAALEKSRAEASALQADLQDVKETAASKDAVIQDLQGKLKGLTEKMKDVMKKYAETKAKSQTLEQAEGKAADLQKALQVKDSELLSLRLKLDNFERLAGDQRAMSTELTDRFAEMQRELNRAKATLGENGLQIVELQRELQQAVSATSGLAAEATATQEKLDEEAKKVVKLTESRTALVAEWETKLSVASKNHSLRVAEMQVENENLLLRLKSEDETAKALEEYKKRAQVALKKANATSSSMASEIVEKKKLADDAVARLAEAEYMVEKTQREMLANSEELRAVKGEMSCLQQNHEDLQVEIDKLRENCEDLNKRLAEASATSRVCHGPGGNRDLVQQASSKEHDGTGADIECAGTARSSSPMSSWAVAAASTMQSPGPSPVFSSSSSLAQSSTPKAATSPSSSVHSSSSPTPPSSLEVQGAGDDGERLDEGLRLQMKATPDQLYYVNLVRAICQYKTLEMPLFSYFSSLVMNPIKMLAPISN